jgi:hypothetical protein
VANQPVSTAIGTSPSSRRTLSWKNVSLFVSEAEFKGSVHGDLSCSDCHTLIKDDTHAAGGKKAGDRRVACGACHKEAEKEYQQGFHSKTVIKRTERAAYCHNCHGKHNILSSKNPKSMTHVSNVEKTCNRCHSNVEFVKEHAMGTGPTPGELWTSIRRQEGDVYELSQES